MPNSPDGAGLDPDAISSVTYGADWIGLDGRAMRARRDAQRQREREARQREAQRQAEELKRMEESHQQWLSESSSDPDESTGQGQAPTSEPSRKSEAEPKEMSRPSALIDRLYIENLESLAGPHEVPLAPLTLIYGPNSAGKSTILNGLQLFMKAVDVGRRDALHVWEKAFEESAPLRSLITWQAPDPEDPEHVHWRPQLKLGVDFRTGDGEVARAELEFEPNPIGRVDYLTSGLGPLREAELSRKMIGLEDPDPFDPDFDPASAFGEDSLVPYLVLEKQPGGDWTSEIKLADAELFAHPSGALKAHMFAMAYLLRYLGPHRGAPTAAYRPLQGPFNKSFSPYELVDYGRWGIAGFGGYEVLNQMMNQLEIPYEFELRPAGADSQEPRWDFKDVRSGALVGLDNVGYGVGQLLPVIDVCVHAARQVICIEEPEIHLHPRLQAKLGNLFATSVLTRGNQVILETHSESILLRVRRLIRRGTLLPSEVAVLYVDNNDEDGATVRRLRLGAQGELLEPWPSGFFDDSLADIMDITS